MAVAYRSICWPTVAQQLSGRRIDQNTGLVLVEISADISVDMSVNMSTDTSGSIHRPSVSQHGHDISVEHWSICRPTCRSMGAQNKHDPRNIDEPTEAQAKNADV